MPKPPILETTDWNAVYDSGVDFDTWLTQGETEDHVKMMKDIHENQVLDDAVLEQLSAITKPASVIAIAEDWCPDVVRHAPILQKICDQSEHLNVRYLTRETGKDIFVRFLTNGGEAIPKFVFLSDQWVECGNWGPMTQAFRDLISRGKACGDVMAARMIIHEVYTSETVRADVVEELMHHVLIATADSV